MRALTPKERKEHNRANAARWRSVHSEQAKEVNRLASENWRKRNPEEAKAKSRQSSPKSRLDISYRLKSNLRTRLWNALKGNSKSADTTELIGCSIESLMGYIQDLFKPGMTWENYGQWHVDHVVPCSRFDLTDPKQQRVCFNYKNLQPLWAEENKKKGKN